MYIVVFVINVPPTAKVRVMETGPWLKVSSDRLVKPWIEPATPCLQGQWFIHYTPAATKMYTVKIDGKVDASIRLRVCAGSSRSLLAHKYIVQIACYSK